MSAPKSPAEFAEVVKSYEDMVERLNTCENALVRERSEHHKTKLQVRSLEDRLAQLDLEAKAAASNLSAVLTDAQRQVEAQMASRAAAETALALVGGQLRSCHEQIAAFVDAGPLLVPLTPQPRVILTPSPDLLERLKRSISESPGLIPPGGGS